MDDLIRRSDAIRSVLSITMLQGRVPIDTVIYQITSIPAVEPNLILPERMERGDVYDVGETITVMNHEDYMDMMCKAMMWDEYGKEPKHGEWIGKGDYEAISVKCSICGRDNGLSASNFCPNCGVRMFAKGINVPNKEGADE